MTGRPRADRTVVSRSLCPGSQFASARRNDRCRTSLRAHSSPATATSAVSRRSPAGGRLVTPLSSIRDRLRVLVAPRALLAMMRYRPAESAARLSCPLLVCAAAEDHETPVENTRALADAAPHGEFRIYPGTHFSFSPTRHRHRRPNRLLPEGHERRLAAGAYRLLRGVDATLPGPRDHRALSRMDARAHAAARQ